MLKRNVPDDIALQVAAYELDIPGEVVSASVVDKETIRIWWKNKKTNIIECVLKPFIKSKVPLEINQINRADKLTGQTPFNFHDTKQNKTFIDVEVVQETPNSKMFEIIY